ncbi:glycosyltransferase family 4 protein [Dehalobacter sp.]|uniref:glycosyltransferase family 4 protein n=1 Tax=Dehalobacter sp. TaxID=1962289 RepID=UPI0025906215|nr:glycosyltransferase family 4 protein [Dehalobacter sp.]MDJ0304943.1 glycosyltransferase family 4 protein [Dehalobacter sp.]
MNILIISDVYVPNANSSAILMRDLALSFVKRGMSVDVLTLLETNIEGMAVQESLTIDSETEIRVLRVGNLKKKKVGLIRRGLSEILLPTSFYRGFKEYLSDRKPDIIVCYAQPITLERTLKKIKKRYGSKIYLVLRDVFPQCAVDVGAIKQGLVFAFFKKIEKELYRVSDFIGVQSANDLKILSDDYSCYKDKIELKYNWIDVEPYEQKEIKRDFRNEFGIEKRMICLYAGNIGKYQELTFLGELIERNQDKSDAVFLIVGSGSESVNLREKYGHLPNVMFKEFISPEDYPDLVRQCDIGLINLNRSLTVHNIPGKLMGYWSAKLPVLASINPGNDLFELIVDADGGLCSITGDLESYLANFNRLYESRKLREKMGMSGYCFVQDHFSVDMARDKIIEHFVGVERNV